MTNKINGIDVSECEQIFAQKKCALLDQEYCEDNPDCYYKQLKRLQKENKRLQMLSCANCGEKYLSSDGAELYEKNVQLQEENEELKKRQITKNGFICDCEQNAKYKQALEEIRIISQNWTNKLMNDGYCEILDKINEVLK